MQIGPRIRFDSHTLGNLAKNVSPALAFTPLGLGGTALLAAAGEYGRGHHSFGDLAKAAGSNVAIGAGARGLAGHYGVLGQGGANAAATTAPTTAAPAPAMVSHGGLPLPATPDLTTAAPTPPGTFGKIGDVAASVGHFAADHDKTTGAVLSGIGQIAQAGPQNRIANAQSRLADLQAEQQQQDLDRRKAQDAALEPLRQAIYGRLGQSIGGAQ